MVKNEVARDTSERARRAVESVRRAQPRVTAQVRFPDGQVYEAPVGTRLEDYIHAAHLELDAPVTAALVDGELAELTYSVTRDVDVVPLSMHTRDLCRSFPHFRWLLLSVAGAFSLYSGGTGSARAADEGDRGGG